MPVLLAAAGETFQRHEDDLAAALTDLIGLHLRLAPFGAARSHAALAPAQGRDRLPADEQQAPADGEQDEEVLQPQGHDQNKSDTFSLASGRN